MEVAATKMKINVSICFMVLFILLHSAGELAKGYNIMKKLPLPHD
jgi:hypothetical protein